MPHRIDDQERVRRGHFDRLDPEAADRQMAKRLLPHTPGPATRNRKDDWRDGYTAPRPEVNPAAHEAVARDLARTAVLPAALAIPCPSCNAAAGVYCTSAARGVCGSRVRTS